MARRRHRRDVPAAYEGSTSYWYLLTLVSAVLLICFVYVRYSDTLGEVMSPGKFFPAEFLVPEPLPHSPPAPAAPPAAPAAPPAAPAPVPPPEPVARVEPHEVAQVEAPPKLEVAQVGTPPKLEVPLKPVPNHLEVEPREWLYLPKDFRDVPLLPDSVWEASLADTTEDFPLMQAMLARLWRNETVRIQMYGGSMTFGEGCTVVRKQACSWPTQVLARLRQSFPGASITLDHRARGGCDHECAMPEMAMSLGGGHESYDLVMLDFCQNGMYKPENLETLVRLCHFFMPNTLVIAIYNRDMGNLPGFTKDLRMFRSYKAVATHYGLPLLNFQAAMEKWTSLGGNWSLMWSEPEGKNRTRHPSFATHAYYADMVAYFCNRQLQKFYPPAQLQPPMLRKPLDLKPDQEWMAPYYKEAQLSKIPACIPALTQHVAREPRGSPRHSDQGHWQLYEDRPNKPGWITNTTPSEFISFNVSFGKHPKLMVQYLRSYNNLGRAEIVFDRWTWKWKGQRKSNHTIPGRWPERISVTVNALFVVPEEKAPTSAVVSFRLIEGPKFKIVAVFSC